MDTHTEWKDFSTLSFSLYRNPEDKDPLVLSPGDCITWDGRNDYVKIVEVFGYETEVGPCGFTYLPYREDGRWASPAWCLRGDARFVICYPAGTPHYGLHIPLGTIRKDDAPLYMDPPGEMTFTYQKTILEIRHSIMNMCSIMELSSKFKQNVYLCENDDVKFTLILSRIDEISKQKKYRVDVYPVSDDMDTIRKYVELI